MDIKKAPPLPPPPVPPRPSGPTPPSGNAGLNKKQVVVHDESVGEDMPTPIAVPAPTTPSPTDTDVVIRTMQDDLKNIAQAGKPQSKPPIPAATAAPAIPTPQTPPPAVMPAAAPRAFPLPPQAAQNAQQKVVLSPHVTHRAGRTWKILGVVVVLLLLAGGGAAAAWYLLQPDAALPSGETAAAEATQVLPAESVVLLQYTLRSLDDRSVVSTAWNAKSQTATLATLVEGDPRLLLSEPTVSEFYYVLLEENARPFLVVPKTPETTRIIATGADVHFIEQEGWYVVHALTTAPYEAALAGGTLAPTAAAGFIQGAPTAPVRLLLGQATLPQLRTGIAGTKFLAGMLQGVQLNGAFAPSSLSLEGTAVTLSPPSEGGAVQDLLTTLPADVSFARLGANFAGDLGQWLTLTSTVDSEVLNRPIIKQRLSQLTGAYALFGNGSGVDESLGLVIALPPGITPSPTLADAALEEAMPALVPLLLDQRTVAPITFSETVYNGIALRYANIVGTSKALDYALTDTHLIVATSKDMMLQLLDIAGGTGQSLATATTTPWQDVIDTWPSLPPAHDMVLGNVVLPGLLQVLPATGASMPLGMAVFVDGAGAVTVIAELALVSSAAPSPLPSSTAVPAPITP